MLSKSFALILEMSFKASILIIFILLIQRILRYRLPAKWRYAFWAIIFFRLAIPFGIESRLSLFNFVSLWSLGNRTLSASILEQNRRNFTNEEYAASVETIPTYQEATQKPNLDFLKFLAVIWMLGVLFLIGQSILLNKRLWRKARNFSRVTDGDVLNIFYQCKRKLNISRTINVVKSKNIKVPALLGIIHPHILIPNNLIETLGPNEIENICVHELNHLKRSDLLVAGLAAFLQIIHWFNPLIWLAFAKMRMVEKWLVMPKHFPFLARKEFKTMQRLLYRSYTMSLWNIECLTR
jgi:bla regulator protein BlaR1